MPLVLSVPTTAFNYRKRVNFVRFPQHIETADYILEIHPAVAAFTEARRVTVTAVLTPKKPNTFYELVVPVYYRLTQERAERLPDTAFDVVRLADAGSSSPPTSPHRSRLPTEKPPVGALAALFAIKARTASAAFHIPLADQPTTPSPFGLLPSFLPAAALRLKEIDGLDFQGIFRVSASNKHVSAAERLCNCGQADAVLEGTLDPSIVGTLIQRWFRHAPQHLLDGVPSSKLLALQSISVSDDAVAARAETCPWAEPAPERAIWRWLVSLLADTAEMEAENLMSPRALAIVFSPGLWAAPSLDAGPNLPNLAALPTSLSPEALASLAAAGSLSLSDPGQEIALQQHVGGLLASAIQHELAARRRDAAPAPAE
jgi:hypothetical protein